MSDKALAGGAICTPIPTMLRPELGLTSGQYRTACITDVYDPSKFWLVIRHVEYEVFHTFLFRTYFDAGDTYRLPATAIAEGVTCVIHIEIGFFRARIVHTDPDESRCDRDVTVFLVDTGHMRTVHPNKLYRLTEDIARVPRFSMRAQLARLRPKKSASGSNHLWRSTDVSQFAQLVLDRIVTVKILHVNYERQMLAVDLVMDAKELPFGQPYEYVAPLSATSCSVNVSGDSGVLSCSEKAPLTAGNNNPNSGIRYPYLFPDFQRLEQGRCPMRVLNREMLDSLSHFTGRGTVLPHQKLLDCLMNFSC